MHTAEFVTNKLEELKKTGNPLDWVAFQFALLCVGWAYVFGARGEFCSPANRRSYYKSKGAENPTIKTKCQVIRDDNPKVDCDGCKWYPGGRTRFYDCRGFTYWVILQVFGFKIMGSGCTSQWNTESNWIARGEVSDGIPQNTLVCLFYYKKEKGKRTKTLAHTGLYYNGETVECSSGVQHSKTINSKWEVWAVPACCQPGEISAPTEPTVKVLKKGSKGAEVRALQTLLIQKGYPLPKFGADGDFGNETLAAVKAFQKDHGLKVDGIVGPETIKALEAEQTFYSITIPHLSKSLADALMSQYPGSSIIKEGGE